LSYVIQAYRNVTGYKLSTNCAKLINSLNFSQTNTQKYVVLLLKPRHVEIYTGDEVPVAYFVQSKNSIFNWRTKDNFDYEW